MQISDIHVGELLFEFCDSLLGEVALHEEVSIGDQEVWVGFLDVALEWLLEVLANLVEISTLVKHFSEQLLECTLLSLSLAHSFLMIIEMIVCLFKSIEVLNLCGIS